jgi:hypothetical protein
MTFMSLLDNAGERRQPGAMVTAAAAVGTEP